MKNLLFCILALTFLQNTQAEELDYYGSRSTEANIKFEYFVETSAETDEQMAKLLIDRQLTYLFGALSSNEYQAVPKADHKTTLLRTEKVNSLYRVYYQYQGTAVVTNGAPTNFSFPLPRNPETIYERSLIRKDGRVEYACHTDRDHTQETYFWYFWNPNMSRCPLIEGQDYDVITSKLTRKLNTTTTYPEYSRLADDGVIRIDLLMGLNEEHQNKNPFQSSDIAAWNYRSLHNQLLSMGYQPRVWSPQDIREIAPKTTGSDAFVESLTKTTQNLTVEIRFFFGATSTYASGYGGSPFHYFMKDALEKSDIFLYAGHSGLGEYLNLQKIENITRFQFQFSPKKYQIYFMNGCSSYPYYNSMYFAKKGGTKNLDILTNGLATLFNAINPSSLALISAMDSYAAHGTRTSYQQIVSRADSENLLGINGDEDNN